MTPGPIQIALQVADALDATGLTYLVGGSVASSVSGEPRTTLDVDIVVAMGETDVARFVAALGPDYYANDEAILRAIRQRSSVNLIHQPSAIKVDLFIAGGSPLDAQQLARRQRVQVSENPSRYLYVHTPEDILLQKLRWFRLGQEASDRQWRDALGILLLPSCDYHDLAAAHRGLRDGQPDELEAGPSPASPSSFSIVEVLLLLVASSW